MTAHVVEATAHDVDLWGLRFDVIYRPVTDEVCRRQVVGLGALDAAVPRRLWSLPAGVPVPLGSLNPWVVVWMCGLDPGVVSVDGDMVTRLAVAPIAPERIVMLAATRDQAVAAGFLRTHAPVVLAVPTGLVATVESLRLPFGIATDDGLHRAPGPWPWVKPSWRRWVLCETAWAAACHPDGGLW